jgi:hypothetical protein
MRVILLALGAAVASSSTLQGSVRGYFIGNSLTNDASPWRMAHLASSLDEQLTSGYHVRGAWSLADLYAAPADVNATFSPAPHPTALATMTWDYLSLQPYRETVANAADATAGFVASLRSNPANANSRVFLYQTWMAHNDATMSGFDYDMLWLRPANVPADLNTYATRDYWDQLMAAVNPDPRDPQVGIVPVGEAMLLLEREIRAGNMPGLDDMVDVYRDVIHLNGFGRYLAAMTHMMVMYQQPFLGEPANPRYFVDGVSNITDQQALVIQTVAWEAVINHPYSLVPEPATLGIILGGAVLLLRRRG